MIELLTIADKSTKELTQLCASFGFTIHDLVAASERSHKSLRFELLCAAIGMEAERDRVEAQAEESEFAARVQLRDCQRQARFLNSSEIVYADFPH